MVLAVHPSKLNNAFHTTLSFIAFAILVRSLYEAWRARNLSTEFQETDSIFRALFLVLLASFIGIPGKIDKERDKRRDSNAKVLLMTLLLFQSLFWSKITPMLGLLWPALSSL